MRKPQGPVSLPHIVQREEPELATIENQVDKDISSIIDIRLAENDLFAATKELRKNSSSDPHAVTAIRLKKAGTNLSVPLKLMCKKSK